MSPYTYLYGCRKEGIDLKKVGTTRKKKNSSRRLDVTKTILTFKMLEEKPLSFNKPQNHSIMKPINLSTAVQKPESIPFSHYSDGAKPEAKASRQAWAHPYLKALLEKAGLPGNTKVALAVILVDGFGLLNRIELELPDGQQVIITPTQMNNRANRVRTTISIPVFQEVGKGKNKEIQMVDETLLVNEERWTTGWKALRDHVNPPAPEGDAQDNQDNQAARAALAAAEQALAEGGEDALAGVEPEPATQEA